MYSCHNKDGLITFQGVDNFLEVGELNLRALRTKNFLKALLALGYQAHGTLRMTMSTGLLED